MKEFKELRRNTCVASSSKLSSLTPSLNEKEIIRVGGRLKHSFKSSL